MPVCNPQECMCFVQKLRACQVIVYHKLSVVLFASAERVPSSTILVAIPANMQPGDAISTNLGMMQQSIVQGTILDMPRTVTTGVPLDAAAATGHLVFMPDLSNTLQLWHNQRFVMLCWFVSSLVLLLFAPLFMASGLFLAAEIAAVMGVIASVVQLCEKELAASNSKSQRLCLTRGTCQQPLQRRLQFNSGSLAAQLKSFLPCRSFVQTSVEVCLLMPSCS